MLSSITQEIMATAHDFLAELWVSKIDCSEPALAFNYGVHRNWNLFSEIFQIYIYISYVLQEPFPDTWHIVGITITQTMKMRI